MQIDYRDGVLELYIQPPHFTKFKQPRGERTAFAAQRCSISPTRLLRFYDRHHLKSLRARALRHAENWILEHQDANGSWGGIQPCYLLSAMALKALGYRNDHPVIEEGARRVARADLGLWATRSLYMPCVSPNWDTALAAKALLDSGLRGDHPALTQCRASGSSIIRSSSRATGR